MPPRGTTGVVVRIDTYNRAAGSTGALTTLPATDLESAVFRLPNAKTVRVDGLAEVFEHMLKNGKWVMPDCQLVVRTDITAAGTPNPAGAYAILQRPEAAGIKRTFEISIAAGMSITWEVHQDTVGVELPKDLVMMTTHNLKHADGSEPVMVGF